MTTNEQPVSEQEPGGAPERDSHPFYPTHVIDEVLLFYLVITMLVTLAILKPFGLHGQADPLSTPAGIKPEWYFLPMYQLLKYVPEVLGVLGMGAFAAGLVLWPFIDRFLEERFGLRRLWKYVGVLGILATVTLGVLGHVSHRNVHVFGQTYHFDLKGVPHKVAPGEAVAEEGSH